MSATFISLHNKHCVGCGHFVDGAREFHDSCHFTKGNTMCPAKTHKLGIGVPVEKAATSLSEAMFNGDAAEVSTLAQRLAKYPVVQQQAVFSRAFDLWANHYGIEIGGDDDADEETGSDAQETAQAQSTGTGTMPQQIVQTDLPVVEAPAPAVVAVVTAPAQQAAVVATPAATAPTGDGAGGSDDDDEWTD
jgi:hypothetical protein